MHRSVEIKRAEIELLKVNADLASFKCNSSVFGIVHLPDSGPVTVLLDGGYVLGEFDCPVCAVKGITYLCLAIDDAEKLSGMNYKAYKQAFKSGSLSRMH
jgi:hypothetical protein